MLLVLLPTAGSTPFGGFQEVAADEWPGLDDRLPGRYDLVALHAAHAMILDLNESLVLAFKVRELSVPADSFLTSLWAVRTAFDVRCDEGLSLFDAYAFYNTTTIQARWAWGDGVFHPGIAWFGADTILIVMPVQPGCTMAEAVENLTAITHNAAPMDCAPGPVCTRPIANRSFPRPPLAPGWYDLNGTLLTSNATLAPPEGNSTTGPDAGPLEPAPPAPPPPSPGGSPGGTGPGPTPGDGVGPTQAPPQGQKGADGVPFPLAAALAAVAASVMRRRKG